MRIPALRSDLQKSAATLRLALLFALIMLSTALPSAVRSQVRWADSVIAFSTQYSTTAWAAFQILGPPNVYPNYGDIAEAWSPASTDDQREFIELYYLNPAPVASVAIYETFNPGSIDTVYVRNPNTGQWQIVWSGTAAPTGVPAARIFIVNFPRTSFNVTDIRLAMNSPAVPGWNEIDAVGISSSPIIVNRPDLIVSEVDAPTVGYSGQNIDVHWVVKNQGTAATTAAAWSDNLYLSTRPVFIADSSVLLAQAQNVSSLDTGQSYANTQTVTLPQGISGNNYVFAVTNADHRQGELVDTNNTGRIASAMTVNLTPPPDLRVASIVVPGSVFSGESLKVSWTVKNFGTGSTIVGQWDDQLFLTKDSALYHGTALSLGIEQHNGILAPDSSYTASATIQIPDTIYGTYFLYVWTNVFNSVYEYIWNNNNTAKSDSIHVTLTPPPDLTVTSLAAPPGGNSGQPITVSWRVQNQGPGPPLDTAWHDEILLSSLPSFNPDSSTVLGTFTHTGTLLPDSTYLAQRTVYLPNGISGNYYLYVWTNWDHQVFEYLYVNNNVRRSDSTLQVALSPWPDLAPQSVLAPSQATAGQQISLTWSVANNGTATAGGSPWVDRISLSTNPTWDSAGLIFLGDVGHNQPLTPSGHYTQTATVTIPSSLSGTYYLYVYTDATNLIYEYSAEGNNFARSGALTIQPYPPVDLAVRSLSVPPADSSGRPLNVQWTVQNVGSAATVSTAWWDAVYLSTDTTLNSAGALLVAAVLRNAPLNPGESYTRNESTTVPDGLSGSYYVLVRTDTGNRVNDSNLLNNLVHSAAPIPITLSPPPDLQVTSINVPAQATAGQPVTISWTVQNTGAGGISGKQWFDAVYLTGTPALDKSALKLATIQNTSALLPDSSYTDSVSVAFPSYAVGNNYYVLVQTDSRNDIYEGAGESNNVNGIPISVVLPPASDLAVTAISIPDSARPGDLVTIGWQIQNLDSNAAVGDITDGVYLSPDTAWSVGDPLVGTVTRYINLAMGAKSRATLKVRIGKALAADSSGTFTGPLPGAAPGPYHVIVRTNILRNIPEISWANNTLASQATLKLDIPSLQPGIVYHGTIAPGQAQYFFFNASGGADYSVTLNGGPVNNFDELFASFNAVPTRAMADFVYPDPNAPNQQIVIPNAQSGRYYIMADKLSGDSSGFTLLVQELAFAVDSVRYSIAGTGGEVTVEIFGARFRPGCTASLHRAGYADVADNSDFLVSSTHFNARFPTAGLANGAWDVVVTNPDSQKATLAGGLTLVDGEPMQLDISFEGIDTVRIYTANPITIYAHNRSNVNIQRAIMFIEIRPDISLSVLTDPIPGVVTSWSQNTDAYYADDGRLGFVLEFCNIAPQRTKSVVMLATPLGLGHYTITAQTFITTRAGFDSAMVQAIQEGIRQGWISTSSIGGSVTKARASFGTMDACPYDDPGVCDAWNQRQRNIDLSGDAAGLVQDALNVNPITPPDFKWLKDFAGFLNNLLKFFNKYSPSSGYAFESIKPYDPNDLVGPAGAGDARWVAVGQTLPFTIHFENDPKQATAPAQAVKVTLQLDSTVDARSFRLGSFGFGTFASADALGRSFYTQRLDVRDSLGIFVDVNSGVDVTTNSAFWTFKSIDTSTGQLPLNPLTGFLPVDDSVEHRGEAFVSFTVRPRSTSHTRDLIHTKATIVFDQNEPLDTRPLVHTIDAGIPSSAVLPLPPATSLDSFLVRWTARDDSLGSGIRSTSVFVSQNGGPFDVWLIDVPDTVATFPGARGNTYRFFSVTKDVAGNLEPMKSAADATTVVTSVREQPSRPRAFALYQNYPNPFNPVTVIRYDLPQRSRVTLEIYDILGQLVSRLEDGIEDAGARSRSWNGGNFASGVYFYRLEATGLVQGGSRFVDVKKMLLIK